MQLTLASNGLKLEVPPDQPYVQTYTAPEGKEFGNAFVNGVPVTLSSDKRSFSVNVGAAATPIKISCCLQDSEISVNLAAVMTAGGYTLTAIAIGPGDILLKPNPTQVEIMALPKLNATYTLIEYVGASGTSSAFVNPEGAWTVHPVSEDTLVKCYFQTVIHT